MLKFANDLSDDYEYAIVWWGQSNARPWGDRDLEGYVAAPHLALTNAGQDLTILSIVNLASDSAQRIAVKDGQSRLLVAEALTPNHYVGAELRLVYADPGESTVTRTAGYGTVVSNTDSLITVQWTKDIYKQCTIDSSGNNNHINYQDHPFSNGNIVYFSAESNILSATSPALALNTPYYVINSDTNKFSVAASLNGAAITLNNDGLTIYVTTTPSNNIPGYVNILGYWQSYDNIRVLTPYTPEAPGDYPAGAPSVPGYTFPATVTGYKDTALWKNFAWNEGVEGYGASGTSTNTGASSMTDTGASWRTDIFAGGYVRCGSSRAKIASNTKTVLTLDGDWVGGTPSNTSSYEIAIPHWRDNPYAFDPGFGFRYPSNDMMPCSASTLGQLYNRPRGRLTYGYKTIAWDFAKVNDSIKLLAGLSSNVASSPATAATGQGSFSTTIVVEGATAKLRLGTPNRNNICSTMFAVGQVCNLFGFDKYSKTGVTTDGNSAFSWTAHGLVEGAAIKVLDKGTSSLVNSQIYYVRDVQTNSFKLAASVGGPAVAQANKSGISLETTSINTEWFVTAIDPAGTYMDLVPRVPSANYASVGQCQVTANPSAISHLIRVPHHRYGAMLECAWNVSNMIGKRINVINLGINSSAQILRNMQNYFGFKGKIGWWDYNKYLDWTPGNPDGNATRLRRMIEIMAPAAISAEGSAKPLRILGIFGFQGEGDAIVKEGRELYEKTLHTFYGWLRNVIYKSGQTFFNTPDRIPVVHASLPTVPWEQNSFAGYGLTQSGDTEGLVNAAIAEFVAKDGFAGTFDTNSSPKLYPDSSALVQGIMGSDPLHFNGFGETINGRTAASTWATVALDAIPHNDKEASLAICNMALAHIGDTAKITSIEPPDGSVQATLCSKFYPMARDSLMEMLSWSFATRRRKLVEVSNETTSWDYAYAMPPDVASAFTILPPDVSDDYSTRFAATDSPGYFANNIPIIAAGRYAPQPFAVEVDSYGNEIIYTDQENAEIRYIALATDASKFSPLFTVALSWHLASMLAGPIMKGDVGAAEAKRCQQMMAMYLAKAQASDSQQRNVKPEHIVQWMSGR